MEVENASKVVFALKSYTHADQEEAVSFNLIANTETVLTIYQRHLKGGVEVIKSYSGKGMIFVIQLMKAYIKFKSYET